jgi:hypothetical protein
MVQINSDDHRFTTYEPFVSSRRLRTFHNKSEKARRKIASVKNCPQELYFIYARQEKRIILRDDGALAAK